MLSGVLCYIITVSKKAKCWLERMAWYCIGNKFDSKDVWIFFTLKFVTVTCCWQKCILLQILCIHLKRFRHEFAFSSKINSYVLFPLEGLDMRPYLHKGLHLN
jgi:hypothetical protein